MLISMDQRMAVLMNSLDRQEMELIHLSRGCQVLTRPQPISSGCLDCRETFPLILLTLQSLPIMLPFLQPCQISQSLTILAQTSTLQEEKTKTHSMKGLLH